jgi:zinc transport system substrate-binding protein
MHARRRSWGWALGVALSLLGGLLLAPGCKQASDPWPPTKAPRVLTSFAPLYCFALNVAGDHAAVLTLLSTTGPHDYQPSSHDSLLLRRADLFFINGLGLDDQLATKLKNASGNRQLRLIELGEGIPQGQLARATQEDGADHHAGHSHGHAHGSYDPHVWLGIPEAICMVERIRDELKGLDAAHVKEYEQRAGDYIARLNTLQTEGKAALAGKTQRKLITFHESLQYFARSFDLTIAGTIQPRPGVDPDPVQISQLVQRCREQKIMVIAVEPQYQQNTAARTLLQEIQKKGLPEARSVIVDPLETVSDVKDLENPGYYEQVIRHNLRNLAEALP